jgi:SAM-dependent methyltransferase
MILGALRAIYTFNQYYRDRWVALQACQVATGSRVLDIGAGSCPYRNLFAGCRYETHDLARLNADQLSGRSGYGSIDYVSDILAIPVPDASFDVILCTEVLEHVPEPILAVKEFSRILKPGGKLILTAPLGSGLHQEPYHFYSGFSPRWYRRYLAEAGFSRICIEANGGFFRYYGQESIRFALILAPWRGIRNLFLAPLWFLSLPWLILVAPLAGHLLDRLDREKAFTVGYHVTALRSS